jgi:hypothetical protein
MTPVQFSGSCHLQKQINRKLDGWNIKDSRTYLMGNLFASSRSEIQGCTQGQNATSKPFETQNMSWRIKFPSDMSFLSFFQACFPGGFLWESQKSQP